MPRPAGATSGSSRTTTAERSCGSFLPGRCACCSPSAPAVQISSTKPFKVVDARGKVRKLKAGTQNLVAAKLKPLRLPLRYVPGGAPLQLDGTAYRGALLVHRRAGKLTVVNRLPLDRYLRGVVPWEMPDDWQREALRAQAVVARSYALATLKPGALFDLYADTRSQVYGGIPAEAASTNRAIGSTAGRVALLERACGDDLLPLDLGREDRLERRGMAGCDACALSRLGLRSLRRALEAPPLGTVPVDAGRRGTEARDRCRARPRRLPRAVGTRRRGDDQGLQRRPERCSRRTFAACSTFVRRGSRCGS